MSDKSDLEKLKKNYKDIQKKYSLPEFEDLNKYFGIEKVADVETDYLIREIRRYISEKLYSYLRFTETLLNPANAPIWIFSVIKTMDENQKSKISEIYKKLAENELKLFEIDLNFSEESEANFIKEGYRLWIEIKKELSDFLNNVKSNWDNKFEVNNKGYFG